MSALKDALKTKAQSNSSSKGPKFYNNQKTMFIKSMATSPLTSTRVAVAGSEYVPATTLKDMLTQEQDIDVLRTLLMNPRTPLKALKDFTESAQAQLFEDDEEIETFLKNRVKGSADSSNDVSDDVDA
ncbi:MAG: hypothetical protein U9R15_04760 [Chloroflexota bacterium]|nr:hypothetical protein [Chloroflexota bacterium]